MTELTDRERWLQALESGDYEQGRNYMRRDVDGRRFYCCMGVACELFGYELLPGGNDEFGVSNDDLGPDADNTDDVQSQYLPDSINRQLDLTLRENGTLASLNDTWEYSFAEIAQFVREADAAGVRLDEYFEYQWGHKR